MEKTYTIGFSHEAAFREDNILVKNWVLDGAISGSWVMEEYNKGEYSPREGDRGWRKWLLWFVFSYVCSATWCVPWGGSVPFLLRIKWVEDCNLLAGEYSLDVSNSSLLTCPITPFFGIIQHFVCLSIVEFISLCTVMFTYLNWTRSWAPQWQGQFSHSSPYI